MATLFLLRHGETDFNLNKVVQGGGIDSSLNPTGHEQGRRFYEAWKDHPFEAMYCSGLQRTRQTLAAFEEAGRTIVAHPGLNEMGWGELEGKPFNEESHARFMEMNDLWAEGQIHLAFPGGESPLQVWNRAASAIQDILDAHPEGNILICTHGRTLRILLSGFSGYGITRMNWFPHDNTGLNILRSPGTAWFFDRINCLNHLTPIPA